MPTTYELAGEARALCDVLDAALDIEDDADALGAVADELDRHVQAVADKVAAIGHVLTALGDDLTILAEDKRRAEAAIARRKRMQARVKDLLLGLLQAEEELTGSGKVRTLYGTAYTTTRRVYDYPAEGWPVTLCRVVYQEDRAAAREAIDAGTAPDGFGSHIETAAAWRGVR